MKLEIQSAMGDRDRGGPVAGQHANAGHASVGLQGGEWRLILYTFDMLREDSATRWNRPGLPFDLFDSLDEARHAVLAVRRDLASSPDETWFPLDIERIEIGKIVGPKFLRLAHEGLAPFIQSCEVVETIA